VSYFTSSPSGPSAGTLVSARKHKRLASLSGLLLEDLLASSPLVIFRGFEALDREGLLNFCLSYPKAELLHWENGPVMEVTPEAAPKNYLFSREEVPLHWDGAFHRVPSYLVFQCLKAPLADGGGETRFTHTGQVWESADDATRETWAGTRLSYTTEKVAHYGGSISVDLVQRHPRTGAPILRFAEPVDTKLNPVQVRVEGAAASHGGDLLADLSARFHDPRFSYAHVWEDGDYLVADNYALVHGRSAFTKASPRHLRRVQIL
jgi:alpha-ketoglutarate-dependent taurine dioxygenase